MVILKCITKGRNSKAFSEILCNLNMAFNIHLVFSYASYALQFLKITVHAYTKFKWICFGIKYVNKIAPNSCKVKMISSDSKMEWHSYAGPCCKTRCDQFYFKMGRIAKCFFLSTLLAFSLAKVKPHQFVLGCSMVCFAFPISLLQQFQTKLTVPFPFFP